MWGSCALLYPVTSSVPDLGTVCLTQVLPAWLTHWLGGTALALRVDTNINAQRAAPPRLGWQRMQLFDSRQCSCALQRGASACRWQAAFLSGGRRMHSTHSRELSRSYGLAQWCTAGPPRPLSHLSRRHTQPRDAANTALPHQTANTVTPAQRHTSSASHQSNLHPHRASSRHACRARVRHKRHKSNMAPRRCRRRSTHQGPGHPHAPRRQHTVPRGARQVDEEYSNC